jgi:hypothetical protein
MTPPEWSERQVVNVGLTGEAGARRLTQSRTAQDETDGGSSSFQKPVGDNGSAGTVQGCSSDTEQGVCQQELVKLLADWYKRTLISVSNEQDSRVGSLTRNGNKRAYGR